MTWKHSLQQLPDSGVIPAAFEKIFESLGRPHDIALWKRSPQDDANRVLYAIPPMPESLSDRLPGDWVHILDPGPTGWTLVVGHDDAWEKFGFERPE